jgi:Lrp/AsnC family leucine-responsive transcriptional regulator
MDEPFRHAVYAPIREIILPSLLVLTCFRQYHCLFLPRWSNLVTRALDRLDCRILETLQLEARITNQDLAQRVGLSPAPCWRRLKRLESEGVIAGYATLLSAPAIGLPIQAYALVSLENHHVETLSAFDRLVRERPEVLECHAMSGTNDYLLRIVAASMEAYERFLSSHVLQLTGVRAVNTSFVLRTKKFTTRLPLQAPG